MEERVGFEPTVAKGYSRSPGAPDRPLQHLSTICTQRFTLNSRLATFNYQDGGEGGIRTHAPLNTETAFRERHHQPLGHLSFSCSNYTIEHIANYRDCLVKGLKGAKP